MQSSTVAMTGTSGNVFICVDHEGVTNYAPASHVGRITKTVDTNIGNSGGVFRLSISTSNSNIELMFVTEVSLDAAITLMLTKL